VCGGVGCAECGDTGKFEIACCPLDYITQDICFVIKLVHLYEKGLPPVAGGSLDQCQAFIHAADFVFSEETKYKKKLGIFG